MQNPQTQRADYAVLLYKALEHLQILVSVGAGPGTNPLTRILRNDYTLFFPSPLVCLSGCTQHAHTHSISDLEYKA